jgi:hypothetical protein
MSWGKVLEEQLWRVLLISCLPIFSYYLFLFHVLSRQHSYIPPSMFHSKPIFFTVPLTSISTMTSQKTLTYPQIPLLSRFQRRHPRHYLHNSTLGIPSRHPHLQRRHPTRPTSFLRCPARSPLRAASLTLVFRIRRLDRLFPNQHHGSLLPFRRSCRPVGCGWGFG